MREGKRGKGKVRKGERKTLKKNKLNKLKKKEFKKNKRLIII